jgi:hypothetical protein
MTGFLNGIDVLHDVSIYDGNTKDHDVKMSKSVQVVMFLTLIWEVLSSNLSQNTNYCNRVFVVLLSPTWKILGYDLKLGYECFLPHPLQFIIYCHPFMTLYGLNY